MAAPLTTPVEGGGERFSDAAIAEMKTHPRFGEAIRRTLEGDLELCRRDRWVHRLNRDIGHYFLAMLCLYLHTSGGLSLRRLQALCLDINLCGRDRAIALLIQMRLMGYVTPLPRSVDARVRWYAPTAGLTAAVRAFMRNDLEAAVLLDPSGRPALERFDDATVFERFMQTFGEGLMAAAKVHKPKDPSLDLFTRRAGGMMTMFALILGGREGDVMPPRGPVRVSVRALAQHARVSRAHVLRLLREAEQAGYFKRDSDEGEGLMSPLLRQEIELLFAILFLSMAVCAREAAAEIPVERIA